MIFTTQGSGAGAVTASEAVIEGGAGVAAAETGGAATGLPRGGGEVDPETGKKLSQNI